MSGVEEEVHASHGAQRLSSWISVFKTDAHKSEPNIELKLCIPLKEESSSPLKNGNQSEDQTGLLITR